MLRTQRRGHAQKHDNSRNRPPRLLLRRIRRQHYPSRLRKNSSIIVGFDWDDETTIDDGFIDATSFTVATKSTMISSTVVNSNKPIGYSLN